MNGLVEDMNQTTTATLKKIMQDGIHTQKDWPKLISTVAWTVRSNMHKSTMYKPIHLLIGRHPKLPPECEQFDLDITKNPDITEEEVNGIIGNITSENFAKFLSIRHNLHSHAHSNIEKSQTRQKRNFDDNNQTPVKLRKGDLVLQIKQYNLNRKGGRLDDPLDNNVYIVKDILANGNIRIQHKIGNQTFTKSLPPSHLKKIIVKTTQKTTCRQSSASLQNTKSPTTLMTKNNSTVISVSEDKPSNHKAPQHNNIKAGEIMSNTCEMICISPNTYNITTDYNHENSLPDLETPLSNTPKVSCLISKRTHLYKNKNTISKNVMFSMHNNITIISPHKRTNSKNILQSIGEIELMEALHSPKANNPKYSQSESHNYDPKSKNKINNSTESIKLLSKKTDPPNIVLVKFLHNNSDNVFEDDVIITKEQPPSVFHFKPLTFKSREEVRPLVSINHIDPLSTQKFTNIGSPLIGAPKAYQ